MNHHWLFHPLRIIALLVPFSTAFAMELPVYDFPMAAYSQAIQDYLPTDSADYQQALIQPEEQASQLQAFYKHYYASDTEGLSPWSEHMVNAVLPSVKAIELAVIADFNNQDKPMEQVHYAENFKEHDAGWLNKISSNMDISQLQTDTFNPSNRSIATANTLSRELPDRAPDFHHASLPGQGFPFDNLQVSAIWAGTPLYVLGTTKDKAWSLVLTPDAYFAWVNSHDIAAVTPSFMQQWQTAAKHGLAAVTKTETPLFNTEQQFQLTGYIGAVFPLVERNDQETHVLIPTQNNQHQAIITTGVIQSDASSRMPLALTKKNLAHLLAELQGRPYGWGGAFFFNDCSAEMKSLFTPFGIWLPRNSAAQALLGSTVDLSSKTPSERVNILKREGHPLMTLIYIGGHVMLYMGMQDQEVLTYQQIWGFPSLNGDKRYVIGQSVFLPLLTSFSDSDMKSQSNKAYFKLVYLDKLNRKVSSPEVFAHAYLHARGREASQ